jgi:fatty-acyl-CoA synthase
VIDDVEAIHGWGMTEMSPLGTPAKLNREQSQRPPEEQRRLREKQGHVIYGVDMKIARDVATIDRDGFMRITDRSKDVIKSGGEWISSIEIENIAVAHPAVAEAACIACAHPKWLQRPLLVFVNELPHTADGKLNKLKLREQFYAHLLSEEG